LALNTNQDVEQNRPGKRGSHKKAASSKKKAEYDGEDDEVEGTPTKAKPTKGRGKKVETEANGDEEDENAEGSPAKAKATKGRAKKVKSEASGDGEGDDVLLRGGGPPLPARRVAQRGAEAEAVAEKLRTVPQKRKSSHKALIGDGNHDEELPEEKPAKKSAKKIKMETTPEGQTIEAENNGVDGRRSRVAKNVRGKKTNAEEGRIRWSSRTRIVSEEGKGLVKVEQLDDPRDMKKEARVKTQPETAAKPQARRGRPRKSVKVEGAEEDAGTMASAIAGPESKTPEAPEMEEERKPVARRSRPKNDVKVENADEEAGEIADVPAEAEQETAVVPDPENETKPKAKAARKK
jgi:hypothetical protein